MEWEWEKLRRDSLFEGEPKGRRRATAKGTAKVSGSEWSLAARSGGGGGESHAGNVAEEDGGV